ncbi:hypothetical protein GWK48_04710 [Metallosphaera tengchongensis]|uniref:Uncharacterized protein n=1 Tax=Metallosphaera tengchongensis TaxID=1532350 RepID=A0A6N0NSV3_9CREN|nr:hypothetical protein [Metallosphaera tengchongensis]QKQ99781.1 hypothetical protein GWK48_04710 [Metallosphaera tengchongensis]
MDHERRVREVLTKFEEIIENHSNNLSQLENMLAINQLDVDRCNRIVKRVRRTRKELSDGLKIIIEHFDSISDKTIREETLGIVSYLNLIGFSDEMELLKALEKQMKNAGAQIDIGDDIQQLNVLMELTSKLSF